MTMTDGSRCCYRARDGVLCQRHLLSGAVIPDDWTSPDNLPVFHGKFGSSTSPASATVTR